MAQTSFTKKRANPRFSFFADAQATLGDGTSVPVQLCELSSRGCYIGGLEPIPIGTGLLLRISSGMSTCELRGKVIYLHSGNRLGFFGMGVLFGKMAAEQRSTIDAWLRQLGPRFHPANGKCDVRECLNPAKYRAIWLYSRASKVVCEDHKKDVDGKPYSDVSGSFGSKPPK